MQNLIKTGILDRHFSVKTDGQMITLPLVRDPTKVEIDELRKLVPSASLGLGEFEPRKRHTRTPGEALATTVTADVLPSLPKSFYGVGNMTLLQRDSKLAAY